MANYEDEEFSFTDHLRNLARDEEKREEYIELESLWTDSVRRDEDRNTGGTR